MSSTPIARCKPFMLKCVLVSIALWSSATWAQSEGD